MPNPSGTDHDESDPATDALSATEGPPSTAANSDERRYTAPGFDAGSTQIIDRVPDAETEFIATPTEMFGVPAPGDRAAGPQAIPSRPQVSRRSRRLLPAILAATAISAAALIVILLLNGLGSSKISQEDRIRSTIETFDSAVRNGDLATLRNLTCGQTRDDYVSYNDNSWADTYSRVQAAKQYPVVASIDEVVINGDHAEANVTSYLAFDPSTQSVRSFDLQLADDQWKICQAP